MNPLARILSLAWIASLGLFTGCVAPGPGSPPDCATVPAGTIFCVGGSKAPTGAPSPSPSQAPVAGAPSFNGAFQLQAGLVTAIPCYKETGALKLIAPSAAYVGTITFAATATGSRSGTSPDTDAMVDVGYTQNINDIDPIYGANGTKTYAFTEADHGVLLLGFRSWAADVDNESVSETFTVSDVATPSLSVSVTLTGIAGPPTTLAIDAPAVDAAGGSFTVNQCVQFTATLVDACNNHVVYPTLISVALVTLAYDSSFNPIPAGATYASSQADCASGGAGQLTDLSIPAGTNSISYWGKLAASAAGCGYVEFDVDGSGNPDAWIAGLLAQDGNFYSCH